MFQTTLLYAGVLGVLMAILSIRVPLRRGRMNIPWGDGGDHILATRIRVFGNFVEYVPVVLVLMALLEASGATSWSLHALGAGLVSARLIHAVSLSEGDCPLWRKVGRGIGAMGTWLVLLAASLYAVANSVAA